MNKNSLQDNCQLYLGEYNFMEQFFDSDLNWQF